MFVLFVANTCTKTKCFDEESRTCVLVIPFPIPCDPVWNPPPAEVLGTNRLPCPRSCLGPRGQICCRGESAKECWNRCSIYGKPKIIRRPFSTSNHVHRETKDGMSTRRSMLAGIPRDPNPTPHAHLWHDVFCQWDSCLPAHMSLKDHPFR